MLGGIKAIEVFQLARCDPIVPSRPWLRLWPNWLKRARFAVLALARLAPTRSARPILYIHFDCRDRAEPVHA